MRQADLATLLIVIAISLAFVHRAESDEIVLKDGRKLTWTSIKDLGETYEVETSGSKVSIRKQDVDRIITLTNPDVPPLTGASFTFEKKKKLISTNLLAGLDLKKSAFQGSWTLKGSELACVAGVDANSRLVFTVPVPDEYDLHLEVTRRTGDGDFEIGLMAGGRQGVLALDTASGTVSGFCLEGKTLDASTGISGRFFANGTPRALVCMVRKNGIVVTVDGKDYLTCSAADMGKLMVPPVHAVPSRDSLFLVCWKGTYAITKAVLSSPKVGP